MRVKFVKGKWEEIESNSDEEIPKGIPTISVDGFLKIKLDNIKLIQSKDWDAFFQIDGVEGSGKSTLSFICGYYLSDGKLTLKSVAEGTEDAIEKIQKLPDGDVLIIDEGSLSLSSKDVFNKEQKRLIQIMNLMRQKKMVLIIVSPTFFDLNKYIAVHRTRFLLHVYTDKRLNRGRFCYFGEKKKKILYEVGKKKFNSYSSPRSDFVGRFTNFRPVWYPQYIELKKRTLAYSLQLAGKNGEPKLELSREQALLLVKRRKNQPNPPTAQQLAMELGKSERQIGRYLRELRENGVVRQTLFY